MGRLLEELHLGLVAGGADLVDGPAGHGGGGVGDPHDVVPAVAVLAGDRLGVGRHHRVEGVLLRHPVVAAAAGGGLELLAVRELLDLREVRVAVDAGEAGLAVDGAGERLLRGLLRLAGRLGMAGEAVLVRGRLRGCGRREGERGGEEEEEDEPGAEPAEEVEAGAVGHEYPRARIIRTGKGLINDSRASETVGDEMGSLWFAPGRNLRRRASEAPRDAMLRRVDGCGGGLVGLRLTARANVNIFSH